MDEWKMLSLGSVNEDGQKGMPEVGRLINVYVWVEDFASMGFFNGVEFSVVVFGQSGVNLLKYDVSEISHWVNVPDRPIFNDGNEGMTVQ